MLSPTASSPLDSRVAAAGPARYLHPQDRKPCPFIGYGGMLAESFVAVMALTAAAVIQPGVYFAMNSFRRRWSARHPRWWRKRCRPGAS